MFYKYKKIILYFKKFLGQEIIPDLKVLDLTSKIDPTALDDLKLEMSKFGSVRFLSEKTAKLKKKTQNRTETGLNWPVSVRFFG